jgi:hypothetical protein
LYFVDPTCKKKPTLPDGLLLTAYCLLLTVFSLCLCLHPGPGHWVGLALPVCVLALAQPEIVVSSHVAAELAPVDAAVGLADVLPSVSPPLAQEAKPGSRLAHPAVVVGLCVGFYPVHEPLVAVAAPAAAPAVRLHGFPLQPQHSAGAVPVDAPDRRASGLARSA